MRFILKNCNIFQLPGNSHMLHLGTIGYSLREFIVMHCIRGPHSGKSYIEEAVLNTVDFSSDIYANCKFIKDDNLAADLAAFATEQGLLDAEKIAGQIIETGNAGWIFQTGLKR